MKSQKGQGVLSGIFKILTSTQQLTNSSCVTDPSPCQKINKNRSQWLFLYHICFLYAPNMFIIEMSCLQIICFFPSNICTLWENESPNVKINQITCLYVYKDSENMHTCHVHEIQFCIAWFVYVFSVFPVSIFLLFCSDH